MTFCAGMPKLLKGDEVKLMRVLSRLLDNALAACKVHSQPHSIFRILATIQGCLCVCVRVCVRVCMCV